MQTYNDIIFADAHSCLPLRFDTDIKQLRQHYAAKVRYVSINVGMDINPLAQVMTTIASFRRQIKETPWLCLAQNYADIKRAIANDLLAVSFDLEGSLPLLECVDMIELYHALGVRQIHLAYNRNNSAAGGAHDIAQGLTRLGESFVDAIHANGILMDLSHSSEQTALDICAYSGARPVIYSHANPRAIVDHQRNISDAAMKACAKTGGLVAINGVAKFVGDENLQPQSLIPLIDHAVNTIGIDCVALGLDYCYDDGISDMPPNIDRNYWWPVQAGYDPQKGLGGKYIAPDALAVVAELLAQMNYSDGDIMKICSKNLLNLIAKVWK